MIFSPFLKLPRWLLTAVCAALIFYLTLAPHPLPDNDIPFWEHTDKLVHAIMFGALYVCAWLDIWRGRRPALSASWWLTVPVIIAGGTIELLQGAMAMGRGASWADFAADIAGTLAALLLPRLLPPITQKS